MNKELIASFGGIMVFQSDKRKGEAIDSQNDLAVGSSLKFRDFFTPAQYTCRLKEFSFEFNAFHQYMDIEYRDRAGEIRQAQILKKTSIWEPTIKQEIVRAIRSGGGPRPPFEVNDATVAWLKPLLVQALHVLDDSHQPWVRAACVKPLPLPPYEVDFTAVPLSQPWV